MNILTWVDLYIDSIRLYTKYQIYLCFRIKIGAKNGEMTNWRELKRWKIQGQNYDQVCNKDLENQRHSVLKMSKLPPTDFQIERLKTQRWRWWTLMKWSNLKDWKSVSNVWQLARTLSDFEEMLKKFAIYILPPFWSDIFSTLILSSFLNFILKKQKIHTR